MAVINRLAAFWLVLFTVLALGAATPARADVISDYKDQLDAMALEMRALAGEIERFKIQPRYCLPPYGPVKQPDNMLMQAYSVRAEALNDKYNALKQSLKDFLDTNTWAYGRLQMAGKDPKSAGWWKRWDNSRDKMINERNAKRDALAKAPERDCTPRAKPAIAVQSPAPLALPQPPRIPPFNWPELPPYFCSELEKLDWRIANINPDHLREAQVAYEVARYRSQIEGLVNDHVQADKPIPPALAEARRQAIALSREMDRIEKANAAFYRRFAAIPIIDCRQPTQTEPPRTEPPKQQPGMTDKDVGNVTGQEYMIGELEALIAKINALRLQGKCEEMWAKQEEFVRRLRSLRILTVERSDGTRGKTFPSEILDELSRRASAATKPCPPQTEQRDEPPKAQPPATPREKFETGSKLDTIRNRAWAQLEAMDAASKACNLAAFDAAFRELERLLEEAKAARFAATGANEFSNVTPKDAEGLVNALKDMVRQRRFQRDDIVRRCGQRPPTTPSQTGFIPPSDPKMRTIFEAHNTLRTANGVPALHWDRELVAGAQAWAEQLARTGRLGHAPREVRGKVRENVSQGMIGWGAQQMIGNWLKEEQKFKAGIYPNVSTTGLWEDVSHYTQMIWAETTSIGCGMAVGSGSSWLVCRYSPGGNKDGDYVGPKVGQTIADGPKTATPPPAGDIAPIDSTKPTGPPPPPPPPTARDDAPNGDESKHPLVEFGGSALQAFTDAWRNGDRATQERELAKARYALEELKKRLKAARKVPEQFRTVDPDKVEQQVKDMERMVKIAEERFNGREEFG